MVPDFRRAYNAGFTQERYLRMVQALERDAGCPSIFRICETPIFLSEGLTRELMAASHEVLGFVTSPEYLAQAHRAVPAHLDVPGDEGHPVFLQIDFAIVSGEDGELTPRLIELQGFPSLYGFQWLLEKEYRAHFPAIPADVTTYFSGLTSETYPKVLRDAIVADGDPENAARMLVQELRTRGMII